MRMKRILGLSSQRGLLCGKPFLALGCLALTLLAPAVASAIQIPMFSLRRTDCVTNVAGLDWYTDYEAAREHAQCDHKMLLVNFLPKGKSSAQTGLDAYLRKNEAVRKELADYVLVRVPVDQRVAGLKLSRKNRKRLIDHAAFKHLGGSAGLAIIDYKHTKQPYYKEVVTALPFNSGKYYHWQNTHLAAALKLPAGTVTQRTMVWAVRTHHERPQSTVGTMHPALATAATKQSAYQASIGVQGHQNWESRFHQVVSSSHAGTASEVVAESWPGQDMIDSCIDCVQSWRHSSGHWGAVRRKHRLYGYDIRQGGNGIWYGTGIFAN
jgi:hypothetical protein